MNSVRVKVGSLGGGLAGLEEAPGVPGDHAALGVDGGGAGDAQQQRGAARRQEAAAGDAPAGARADPG